LQYDIVLEYTSEFSVVLEYTVQSILLHIYSCI
jgi:hypothetical protein